MEDIIKALLDVVRAQHSAAEGTEEEPFNMDDVIDMAIDSCFCATSTIAYLCFCACASRE